MTIHLPEELERFVQSAVRDGLYAREEDVVHDALTRLQQAMPRKSAPRTKPKKKSLTPAEFDQYLLALGLMSKVPDTEADFDDPDDQLIDIRGEPLSETVIRERR
jgi:Arc/MetJ-type ribon-helix-helix transcriptional regulator